MAVVLTACGGMDDADTDDGSGTETDEAGEAGGPRGAYVGNANTEHPEEAFEVLTRLTDDEVQASRT